MISSRSRIALGCLLAVAVGTFGPISRAVSMESRTVVEHSGEIPGGTGQPSHAESHLNARHGASAYGTLSEGDGYRGFSLSVGEGRNERTRIDDGAYTASIDEHPSAILSTRMCDANWACTSSKWTGTGTLDFSPLAVSFSGELRDANGSACAVNAQWRALGTPGGVYGYTEQASAWMEAPGSAATSCLGQLAWGRYDGRISVSSDFRTVTPRG